MFLGSTATGPVVAKIVMIGAVDDGVVVFGRSQGFKLGEQLTLAEVTTIRRVLPVCRVVQFLRFNLQMVEAELLHKERGLFLLELRIGRADGSDTKRIPAQNPVGHVGEVGTVNAAAKAHNDALQPA